ncbi:MAG TPA: adenylate/guanylate cyclase domain-containing protein [Pseudonocardiaceae bacterium]|nr:adenylate/guanylate cyclase domain-containing protein [Pseudonocardiaceae bacterium]
MTEQLAGAALAAIQQTIDLALLGGERKYTRIEAARLGGVDIERAHRLWLSMGFAEVPDDQIVFTDGDVEALRVWATLQEGDAPINPGDETAVVRSIGQAMSRLADWEAQVVLTRVRESGGIPDNLLENDNPLVAVVQSLHNYVWRRHLAAACLRLLSADLADPAEQPLAVGFADIVGYTSTTRRIELDDLGSLLDSFEDDASEAVAACHGRVVKTVGDEVMFVADNASDAADIALRLSDPAREEQGLPTLRVGLAMGPVLSRFGDVYGEAVNVAARLTSRARPGTVLLDQGMAEQLRGNDRYQLRSLRPVSVRGYNHLRLWVLRPPEPSRRRSSRDRRVTETP